MTCNEAILLLSPYADGELSEDEAPRIKAHLEDCDKCSHEVEIIKKMKEYGNNLGFPVPFNVGEAMVKGVKSSNEEMKPKKPLPRWLFYWQVYLVIILLALLFVLIRNGINNRTPDPTADEVMDYSFEYKSDSLKADRTKKPKGTAKTEPTKSPEARPTPKSTEAAKSPKASDNNIKSTEAPVASGDTAKPSEKPAHVAQAASEATETPRVTSTPKATSTPKPSSTPKSSSTPKPSATVTPKADLQKKKDSALAYSVSKVSSLQKLKVNFLLYDDEEEGKAVSIYNSLPSKDAASVGTALSNAGIVYSKSTIVLDDYSSEYNKVVDEINSIKAKISAATTESQVDSLISQLNAKKEELAAIKKKCTTQTGIAIRQ